MHKRHISEFYKTSLANTGRAAGMGMVEDKYGDEDGMIFQNHREPMFEHKEKPKHGEVVIIKKEDKK